jgi:hypothetical protein
MFRVGENTRGYVSIWCKKYLDISFDELDESDMITNPDVKNQYDIAKQALSDGDHKGVLENLAIALYLLFGSNHALSDLRVGAPRAEDALKLSAFGVHANEFLALQEFLPLCYSREEVHWNQEKYDHPANWRQNTSEFCLKTFVSVALRIQDAQWIPGAIEFDFVYEHKVTALVDNVEIFQDRSKGVLEPKEKVVVHVLKKGESIRGKVTKERGKITGESRTLTDGLLGLKYEPILHFINYHKEQLIFGDIEADKVSVTCVPQDNILIHEYFPDLPELEYR